MDENLSQTIGKVWDRIPTDVDPGEVTVVYDGDSDTLLIHLYGRGIAATSLLITDEIMVRYDRSGERVVGIQIEHFLSQVAAEYPALLPLLDLAEMRDADPEAIARQRREIARAHRGAVVTHVFADLHQLSGAD